MQKCYQAIRGALVEVEQQLEMLLHRQLSSGAGESLISHLEPETWRKLTEDQMNLFSVSCVFYERPSDLLGVPSIHFPLLVPNLGRGGDIQTPHRNDPGIDPGSFLLCWPVLTTAALCHPNLYLIFYHIICTACGETGGYKLKKKCT